MERPVDEATDRFLRTLAADLQRQLGVAGDVREIRLDDAGAGVRLVASVAIGARTLEFSGSGETVVEAYAHLASAAGEPVLVTAFREVVGGPR